MKLIRGSNYRGEFHFAFSLVNYQGMRERKNIKEEKHGTRLELGNCFMTKRSKIEEMRGESGS
jgi:hypothetical protein